jgi:putative membrane protein
MKKINLHKKSIAILTTSMLFLNTGFVFANVKKDETVYVILKNNGAVEKSIVSAWINSDKELGEFKDMSNLENITNVKGDEKPTIDGKTLKWNIDKEDLYYRGDSKDTDFQPVSP